MLKKKNFEGFHFPKTPLPHPLVCFPTKEKLDTKNGKPKIKTFPKHPNISVFFVYFCGTVATASSAVQYFTIATTSSTYLLLLTRKL